MTTTLKEIFRNMDYGPSRESPDQALAWIARHKGSFDLVIKGAWAKSKGRQRFSSINPADGNELARLVKAGEADINAAISAAKRAQSGWVKLGAHGRARHLYALARLMQKHQRLFAVLETLDNGKPIRESRDIDIPLAIRHFYHHAGWAQLLPQEFPNHEPLGVVGQIIPWNFPLLMLAWKVAPALAAGNTVVLKPAEDTSLTALLFADICMEAGLPEGVVNIVTGDGDTGALLAGHPGIDKIAFTGSTEVGRLIRKALAGTGKKLTLELGGKSPFIVFEDADLDSAVEGVVDGIWFNQGQVCCAGSRLLIQESVFDSFTKKLRTRMEKLRVGDPLEKSTDMGALVSPIQLKRVRGLIDDGLKQGGEFWQAGMELPKKGNFFAPGLITGVQPAHPLCQIEIFGPVAVAMSFRTPPEAVQLANNTTYGLAASVWSESINLALDVAPKIKAGVVWVNCTNQFDASSGFGGYKESGFGREGGREGMLEYLKRTEPSPAKRSGAKAKRTKKVRSRPGASLPAIDRTYKLYIGGKQQRPDGGYSRMIKDVDGKDLAQVAEGNRKDLRNAVEAAIAASGWAGTNGHLKGQILYYLAENLSARRQDFSILIEQMTGVSGDDEVEAAIARLFSYAAWTDKYEGVVHAPPLRGVVLAMNEPIGVIAVACPEAAPLLGFISMVAPAIAMGNRVVAVPSERHPLTALEFYQLLDTSDVPGGVVNIVTGDKDALIKVLAEHPDVGAVWYSGSAAGAKAVELAAVHDLKRTWIAKPNADWFNPEAEGREALRQATQVKNIWIPYGE